MERVLPTSGPSFHRIDDMTGDVATTESSQAETLRSGVVVMLLVTVLQRGIGFARNLVICRYLSDEALGRWSLLLSFLLLAAPLIVFGLPGTFGRYVEVFRTRGHLPRFLRQIGGFCLVSALAALGLLALGHRYVGFALFHETGRSSLIFATLATLLVVTASNFVSELLVALRRARLLSGLQLASSLVFTIVAVPGVMFTPWAEWAVLGGFAAGAAITCAGGTIALVRLGAEGFGAGACERRVAPSFWLEVLPYAGWMWTTDLCSNLLDTVDRVMLVHLAAVPSPEALVGQYHASRVVPLLLVAIAGMLSAIILPHLVADQEREGTRRLTQRMHRIVAWSALGLTAAAACVLAIRRPLFDQLLAGRYDAGLAVLPVTLLYAVWFGLTLIVQTYLWCRNRARAVVVISAGALAANVALNAWWVPWFGLPGAVWATTLSILLALAATRYVCRQDGLEWTGASTWIWLLPISLLGGVPLTLVLLAAALVAFHRHGILEETFADLPWLARFLPAWNPCTPDAGPAGCGPSPTLPAEPSGGATP